MTEIHDQKPKVFISYSWTTPEHEKWVDELAHSLHDADIHVIFDKWD
ncbi:SEFIR domain-containing protein [Acinetobacter baumannii]